MLCEATGGSLKENIEVTEIKYFDMNNLTNLVEEKCNKKQIEICFKAFKDKNLNVQFD